MKKRMSIKQWLGLGATVIVLTIGIGLGINYFTNQSNIDPNSEPFESTVKRPETMEDSRILIPGYNDWKMIVGTNEVTVALFNPNENPCYFQFNIILDETGEVLFKTGLIPPGEAVTTVKLPRKFQEGVYPITIKIETYALNDDTQQLNSGEVKTNIVALQE